MLHASISLDPKQAHHLFDVLRIQKKETIRVVSKKGGTFLAHPLDKPYLYVFDEIEVPRSAKHITLCASLIKQDRFELMLQKACELGVTKIVPFTSAYSIIRIDPKKIDKKNDTSLVMITIHEGKNHQVKNLLLAVGHEVIKLKREKIAFLDLKGLKPGEYRYLTIKEVKKLYSLDNKNA